MDIKIGGSYQVHPDELSDVITQMHKMDGNVLQVMIRDPTKNGKIKKLKESQVEEIRKKLANYKMKLFIHSPYVINMAHPLAENGPSFRSIVAEMEFLSRIADTGCVVHVGKTVGKYTQKEALINQAKFITEVVRATPSNVSFILETAAGQGTELMYKLKDFTDFFKNLPRDILDRVKICLDTCHIFAAGNAVDPKIFRNRVMKKHLILIHLNDSLREFGSRVDRHQDFGCGEIPKKKLEDITRAAIKLDLPMVIEKQSGTMFCKDYKAQFKMVRGLVK
jgi:deoxyribonuclease-4